MKSRRPLSLLAAIGLVAGTLAAALPASQAATPGCSGLVTAVNSENRIVYRTWKNGAIESEKQSQVISQPIDNLVFSGGRPLTGGGSFSQYTAFRYHAAPVIYDVVSKVTSSTLAVSYDRKLSKWLKGRLITVGGSYYLYAVDYSGNLVQWTRYGDNAGHVWLDDPVVVSRNMGGLKTLFYGWTFKVDGVYKDFVYATTSSGKLLQFQIPQRKPGAETVKKLASSGFGAYDWVSPAGCNNNNHYLAMVAIDHETNQARLYTLASQSVPKTYNLVERGLVGDGADWNLHAVG